MAVCIKWQKEEDDLNCGRCQDCARLAVRMAMIHEEFKAAWHSWVCDCSIDKQDFYEKANELFGTDLNKFMTESLTEQNVKSKEWKLVGTGRLLDEADIKEKYKNKPKRLAAILEHADRCEELVCFGHTIIGQIERHPCEELVRVC